MSAPQRPEGVTVIRADGTTIPCELAYAGTETDMCGVLHVWNLATVVDFRAGDSVHADVLPARTTISIPTSPMRGAS
jgi:hypothetical protein